MVSNTDRRPRMYGLSTCGWCTRARAWLDEKVGEYDLVYVDQLGQKEKDQVLEMLSEKVGHLAFPMVFFGEECVVGYRPEEYERLTEQTG